MITATMSTSDLARRTRIPRLALDEQQAVVDYKRALRAKLAASRALAAARCARERDAAYHALDQADGAIRRGLRLLNEALTAGDV